MDKWSAIQRGARVRRWVKKMDSDPSKWPIAPGAREYMVDCEFCPSRMPLSAMTFHIRRHQRLAAAASR